MEYLRKNIFVKIKSKKDQWCERCTNFIKDFSIALMIDQRWRKVKRLIFSISQHLLQLYQRNSL